MNKRKVYDSEESEGENEVEENFDINIDDQQDSEEGKDKKQIWFEAQIVQRQVIKVF